MENWLFNVLSSLLASVIMLALGGSLPPRWRALWSARKACLVQLRQQFLAKVLKALRTEVSADYVRMSAFCLLFPEFVVGAIFGVTATRQLGAPVLVALAQHKLQVAELNADLNAATAIGGIIAGVIVARTFYRFLCSAA